MISKNFKIYRSSTSVISHCTSLHVHSTDIDNGLVLLLISLQPYILPTVLSLLVYYPLMYTVTFTKSRPTLHLYIVQLHLQYEQYSRMIMYLLSGSMTTIVLCVITGCISYRLNLSPVLVVYANPFVMGMLIRVLPSPRNLNQCLSRNTNTSK